ncbi:MAG: GNAT family N-acetyltransferase [Pirellulales bacterium]
MPTLASPAAATSIAHLDWDTSHFGFSVGRIAPEATDAELHAALNEARSRRYRLVYWATTSDRAPPSRLLTEYDGRLVDRKVTYSRTLPGANPPQARSSDATVAPFEESECSAELTALAIAAGAYSRFAADPAIPRDKFERLYQAWIERSVSGAIADAVLVARDSAAATHLAGMITVKVTQGIGNIGLVAVAESHRGRGIGSQLIDATHRWMIARTAAKATVVTQVANAPACRLYERADYTIEQAENYYHFWP